MKKVLFVDDSHPFLEYLKIQFTDVDGTYCYTGAEGLEQLQHKKFDAVVLDMMMFLDGVTFVKLANGRLKNTDLYFLSELHDEDITRRIESIRERVTGVFKKDQIAALHSIIVDDKNMI